MAVLGDISSRLSANKDKVDPFTTRREAQAIAGEPEHTTSKSTERRGQSTITTHDGHDALQGVKDQVCAFITSCLRGASAMFLPTTDKESRPDKDALSPTRRMAKCTTGRLRTADNIVVNQITLPHEVIY